MIIRYPTGLYANVLPKRPGDSGNVTFTISNTTPPRSDLLYPKVPTGIVELKKESTVITIDKRRTNYGGLVFTISRATRANTGNNARQYEIGQILEFNQISGQTIAPMLANTVTEIRHDTNILDYDQMGITREEQNAIADASLLTLDQLTDKLNALRRLRGDDEQEVNVQQKLINDLTKTINSLIVTLNNMETGTTGVDTIENLIVKLEERRQQAFIKRDNAIEAANNHAKEASKILEKLRVVSTLVK